MPPARRSRARARPKATTGRLVLPLVVAAALLLVGLLIAADVARRPSPEAILPAHPAVPRGEDRRLGPAEAPLQITVWSDFQCPFCRQLALDILPRLEESYISRGEVSLEFRHYAFLGPESYLAAQAAECAVEQKAFWPYHDLLFQSQAGENRGTFRRELFLSLARRLGLDEGAFGACLDGRASALRVQEDVAEAQRLGVRGTPTLRVGDEMVYGLPRWTALAELVESKLAGRR